MNNAKIAITSILSLAIVGEANAQTNYNGSDTLSPIIEALLATEQCGDINYLAEGSGAGQDAMVAGTQQTAPMSSSMDEDVCNPNGTHAVIARDKLVVVRNNKGSDKTCETSFVGDVAGYSSDVPAWAEALQLVYGGVNGAGTAEACGGSGRDNADHPRVKLLNNFSSLFSNSCASGECTELRFAFRRGDKSGTTKVFKKLTGVEDFCGGAQHEDNDPVRTDCSSFASAGNLQYCPTGSFGVVQAIDIPSGEEFKGMNRKECVQGNFDFAFAPFGATECPDGTAPFAGLFCSYPRDCNDKYGCVNTGANSSTFNFFMDGREYNNFHLKADLNPYVLPTTDEGTQFSFFSLFANGKCTGGDSGNNATQQIGCLVSQLDCTIGYGGISMLEAPITLNDNANCGGVIAADNAATGFDVDVNDNVVEDLESDAYPLARSLYFNTLNVSIVGEGNDRKYDCASVANADERALCECVFDKDKRDAAVAKTDFLPVNNVSFLQCDAKTSK